MPFPLIPSLIGIVGTLFGQKNVSGLATNYAGIEAARQQDASMAHMIKLSADLSASRDRANEAMTASITAASVAGSKQNAATLVLKAHKDVAKMALDILG